MSTGGGLENFWLTGELAISALEQVEFLRRLESDALPFKVEHQLFVKDLMIVDPRPDLLVRAKSGWAFEVSPQIAWYVGWAEMGPRRVFFALNLTITDAKAQLPLRQEIVKTVIDAVAGN